MRSVRLVMFIIAVFLTAALPADAEVLITIDKSAQRMTVAVDGAVRWTWPVPTGRRGYATPSGSYTAFRMEEEHYSQEWDDAPMPNSIFFTKRGHAIHGSYETNRLGTPVPRLRAAAPCQCGKPWSSPAAKNKAANWGLLRWNHCPREGI